MMRTFIYLLLIFPGILYGQEGRGDLRFVFYNVENLFDPFDDSLAQDEEFLPGGIRSWSWERFLEKERRLYKVLASAGGWKPPDLIGLCEIENRFVLNWLCGKTPLLKYNYRIIHRDSPDERGIDVALLYRPTSFRPTDMRWIITGGMEDPTRDVLYVRGLVMERDTIHLILCHWPSRWDGYLESMPGRMEAARTVQNLFDSISGQNPVSRILIAGDMNDELSDPSLSLVLRVRQTNERIRDTCLYNTGAPPSKNPSRKTGTLKYRGRWYEFDHIFVGGSFFMDSSLYVLPGSKTIHDPDFLFEKDPGFPGRRPLRTYHGYEYRGGFSDHLPVYIDVWRRD